MCHVSSFGRKCDELKCQLQSVAYLDHFDWLGTTGLDIMGGYSDWFTS